MERQAKSCKAFCMMILVMYINFLSLENSYVSLLVSSMLNQPMPMLEKFFLITSSMLADQVAVKTYLMLDFALFCYCLNSSIR